MIPQHIWDSFSDELRAIVGAVIDALERRIIELRQQVQGLIETRSALPRRFVDDLGSGDCPRSAQDPAGERTRPGTGRPSTSRR